jgi:integrase
LPPARRPEAVVWTTERISEWQRTGIRPSVAVWTPAQTAAFLNAIQGHRLYAAYHRARQLAERAAAGEDYLDSGYVFTRLNGDPMAPDWLSRYFRRLNDASGLPPIRLHDLRHGAASLVWPPGPI